MENLDPLPPLEPGSLTARLLLDVWSGQRLIRADGPVAPHEPEVAGVIAAQMHLRAGANVMIFGGPMTETASRFVRRFVPESSIWSEDRNNAEDIYPEDTPLILFTTSEDHLRNFYFFFDLVIFMSDSNTDQYIGPAYIAGDQLLTFAGQEHVKLVDDSPDRGVPADVASAGSVGR